MAINIDITKGGSGYHLMTILDDAGREALRQDQFEENMAFQTAVNLVNNVHHGKHLREFYPFLRDAFRDNAQADWASEDERAGYQKASALLEEYVDLVESTFNVTVR